MMISTGSKFDICLILHLNGIPTVLRLIYPRHHFSEETAALCHDLSTATINRPEGPSNSLEVSLADDIP